MASTLPPFPTPAPSTVALPPPVETAPVTLPPRAVPPPLGPTTLPAPPTGPSAPHAHAPAEQEVREAVVTGAGGRVPIVYGRTLVGGDIVYAALSGSGSRTRVRAAIVYSEGPIESFDAWWSEDAVAPASAWGHLSTYTGTLTQAANAYVGSAIGRLPATAYAFVETKAGQTALPLAILKGIKLYDPRLGDWTAGVAPPDAFRAWSANPALEMADLLTSARYGLAVPCTSVDWASVAAAANYCDEIVDGAKRAECHIALRDESSVARWFETIGLHFGGKWVRDGATWRLVVHKAGSPSVATILADDLVGQTTVSRSGGSAGLRDLPNRITVKWTDPVTFKERTTPVNGPDVELGRPVREGSEYPIPGCVSERQAWRTAWYVYNTTAATLSAEVLVGPKFAGLLPGDVVTVSDDSVGLVAQTFSIRSVTNRPDGTIALSLAEYAAGVFAPSAYTPADLFPWVDPWAPPAAPADLVLSPEVTVETRINGNYQTVITNTHIGFECDVPAEPHVTKVRVRLVSSAMPRGIASVYVAAGGSGYTNGDAVTFAGGGGGGAAGVLVVSGGVITGVTITNAGSGYTTTPTVIAPGGSGADLYAQMVSAPNASTFAWDDAPVAGAVQEWVFPLDGNRTASSSSRLRVVIPDYLAAFDHTSSLTAGDWWSISGGTHAYRALVRMETFVGVQSASGTLEKLTVDSYSSTSAGGSDPVLRSRVPGVTKDALPKWADNGSDTLVDSRFSDDGTTPKYNTVEILRVGGDLAAASVVTGLRSKALDTSVGSPSNGNVLVYDSTAGKWKAAAPAASGGLVLKAQEFTSGSTNWTAPTGVTEVWVTGCGGGGGGGGVETDTAHGGAGGGGGGASVYRKRLAVTAGNTYSVSVGGAGGAGVSNAATASVTNGGTGGSTTFGALLTLAGGAGGGRAVTTGRGAGGDAGGSGGKRGGAGFDALAGSGSQAQNGTGGISFPGAYGSGGDGERAGEPGYLLVEWNG